MFLGSVSSTPSMFSIADTFISTTFLQGPDISPVFVLFFFLIFNSLINWSDVHSAEAKYGMIFKTFFSESD